MLNLKNYYKKLLTKLLTKLYNYLVSSLYFDNLLEEKNLLENKIKTQENKIKELTALTNKKKIIIEGKDKLNLINSNTFTLNDNVYKILSQKKYNYYLTIKLKKKFKNENDLILEEQVFRKFIVKLRSFIKELTNNSTKVEYM